MEQSFIADGSQPRLSVAVIGTGISGMSAAWLLSGTHDVTVYEKNDRIGGHSNTVTHRESGADLAIDTGFIVYNEPCYPNLVALFDHLEVATRATDMSFAASIDDGDFEYAGSGLGGLFAQRGNLLRPRMWSMIGDILRFYRNVVDDSARLDPAVTLGDYLASNGYGRAFIHDHLLPMGAAIWSTPAATMLDYPLLAFVRFCDNHGLLQLANRPAWRTVVGGSRSYVDALTRPYRDRILLNTGVTAVRRHADRVEIEDRQGNLRRFDHVIMACHADEALDLLADADNAEAQLLGAFGYQRNLAVLHTDARQMPRTRRAWSSWNFMAGRDGAADHLTVTYWMNRLQSLEARHDYFVTLNPHREIAEGTILRSFMYEHPVFTTDAIRAQHMLWNIQGVRRTWFCGAYLGHGFHEDGLQAGLAVAEQLGGVARPWQLDNPSSRIHCVPHAQPAGTARRAA